MCSFEQYTDYENKHNFELSKYNSKDCNIYLYYVLKDNSEILLNG